MLKLLNVVDESHDEHVQLVELVGWLTCVKTGVDKSNLGNY